MSHIHLDHLDIAQKNDRIFNIQIKDKHNMSMSTLSEINNTCTTNGVFSTMQLEKV